jgi:hypothetical protein
VSYVEGMVELRKALVPQNLSQKNVKEYVAWETLCNRKGP